jgi:hypothetical protein
MHQADVLDASPIRRKYLVEGQEGGRDPALAGFGGGDEVEVVEAGEEVALRGEVRDGKGGEGGARGGPVSRWKAARSLIQRTVTVSW